MQYWYATRGTSTTRGMADELVLFEMAKKGRIRPSDLVWSTTTGSCWVPASTIEGLFLTLPAEHETAAALAEVPGIRRVDAGNPGKWIYPLLVAVAMLCVAGAMALVAVKVVRARRMPPPTGFLAEIERKAMGNAMPGGVAEAVASSTRSNLVASLKDRISACIVDDRLAEAEELITTLRQTEGGEELAGRLTTRLGGLKRTSARKAELERWLQMGTLATAAADELLLICRERGEEANLQKLTEDMLKEKSALTPEMSLSAARLCSEAGWKQLEKSALREFVSRAPMSGPDHEFLEVAQMYSNLGEQARGTELLERYLANSPQSSAAWLEVAAVRCSSGDSKAALVALRQAVEKGGDEACALARRDSRFDAIRDSPAFRILIGIK